MSVLTRTIEKHRDFVGREAHYSETPRAIQWDADPSQARAAFYLCTAAHVIAHAHGGFRSRRFDNRQTNLMLQMATRVMTEVDAIITADGLTDTGLCVAVTRTTRRKLRGVTKIVELSRRRNAKAVCTATLDRHNSLRELCHGASTRAEMVRHVLDGPEILQDRACAGESVDDTGTRAVRRPDKPRKWERGRALPSSKRKRRRRRRHYRHRKAKPKADLMRSATADFDNAWDSFTERRPVDGVARPRTGATGDKGTDGEAK